MSVANYIVACVSVVFAYCSGCGSDLSDARKLLGNDIDERVVTNPVLYSDRWGLVSVKGQVVVPFVYEEISYERDASVYIAYDEDRDIYHIYDRWGHLVHDGREQGEFIGGAVGIGYGRLALVRRNPTGQIYVPIIGIYPDSGSNAMPIESKYITTMPRSSSKIICRVHVAKDAFSDSREWGVAVFGQNGSRVSAIAYDIIDGPDTMYLYRPDSDFAWCVGDMCGSKVMDIEQGLNPFAVSQSGIAVADVARGPGRGGSVYLINYAGEVLLQDYKLTKMLPLAGGMWYGTDDHSHWIFGKHGDVISGPYDWVRLVSHDRMLVKTEKGLSEKIVNMYGMNVASLRDIDVGRHRYAMGNIIGITPNKHYVCIDKKGNIIWKVHESVMSSQSDELQASGY